MNKSQIKAIDGNLPDLLERANTGALITYFHAHGAFDFNKYDALRDHLRFPTKQDRAAEFFKTIKDIDGGWNLLEKALIDANQSWLWSQLFDAEQGRPSLPEAIETDFMTTLKNLTEEDALEQFRFWIDVLDIDENFSDAFQHLDIIRAHATRIIDKQNRKIETYQYLSKADFRVFFIEGDPGIGKSTYVSKLAYDWATEEKNAGICEIFQTVFLIRCWKVEKEIDIPSAICQSIGISKEYIGIILDKLNCKKTLIIFDGYDENPLDVVDELVDKSVLQYEGRKYNVFAKMMVTGRGTHAPIHDQQERNKGDALKRCAYGLKIIGFSEEQLRDYFKKYLRREKETMLTLLSNSSMKELLRNPLLALMCSGCGFAEKIFTLESQQRMNEIFESFMTFYLEVSKKKSHYTSEGYQNSFDAVCEYAAYRLQKDYSRILCSQSDSLSDNEYKSYQTDHNWGTSYAPFEGYRPDDKILTKFGLVQCVKSKSIPLINAVQMTYNFFHHTFLEYFAAKWFSNHPELIQFQFIHRGYYRVLPAAFKYFLFSMRPEILLEMHKGPYSFVPRCAFSVAEIFNHLNKPQKIQLYDDWTLDRTNFPKFLEQFKEISFYICKFGPFKSESNDWNSDSISRFENIETIKLRLADGKNVGNLLKALSIFKPCNLKLLTFDYLWMGKYPTLPDNVVVDFQVDEICIKFGGGYCEQDWAVSFIAIMEKLLGKFRRCTWDVEYLDLVIQVLPADGRKKLKAIAETLGDNFLLEDAWGNITMKGKFKEVLQNYVTK